MGTGGLVELAFMPHDAHCRAMARVSDNLRFAVCAFDRVFDTAPKQERVSLAELLSFLSRFEVKPQVLQRMQKDVAKVQRAVARVEQNQSGGGPVGSRYRTLRDALVEEGATAEEAATTAEQRLMHDARRAVKRDLRLWSPVRYQPGAKRGSDNVMHLSCLVLDYDAGVTIEEASACWAPWLHIAHTTWSHTDAHHKFRLILPLAHPVAAKDWDTVWEWGSARAGGAIDSALKGPGATYAVPTVPHADWPRRVIGNDGPLLSPLNEGLVARAAPSGRTDISPVDHPLALPRPKYDSLVEPHGIPLDRAEDAPWESDDLWDGFGGTAAELEAPAEVSLDTPERDDDERDVASPEVSMQARIAALESRVGMLEQASSLVDALERVAALHAAGALDDEEFSLAKRTVLAQDGEPSDE